MRQAGEEVYGYDHEDDPRSHINPAWLVNHPGAPLCYLCYLLPSRDVEDIKGEAGLDSSKPAKKPHIWEREGLEQKPKPQTPQSTAKAAQTSTTWDLPIPGARTPWDTISTTDNAEQACLELVTSALDDKHATPGQVHKATAALEKLVLSRKPLGDTFWTQGRRAAAAAIVREEFEDIFKEELPIREGPEVDTTKTPATIRFKDSYDGETPFRKGIKMAPRELQQCREQLLELLQKGYIGPSALYHPNPL
jgi:hypothetical protein